MIYLLLLIFFFSAASPLPVSEFILFPLSAALYFSSQYFCLALLTFIYFSFSPSPCFFPELPCTICISVSAPLTLPQLDYSPIASHHHGPTTPPPSKSHRGLVIPPPGVLSPVPSCCLRQIPAWECDTVSPGEPKQLRAPESKSIEVQ